MENNGEHSIVFDPHCSWYRYRRTLIREEQVFMVNPDICFTYKQIKENPLYCLKILKDIVNDCRAPTPEPKMTTKELSIIHKIMLSFIEMVDDDLELYEADLVRNASPDKLPGMMGVIRTDRAEEFLYQRLEEND